MDLQGKNVVITGASSGIGLAFLKQILKMDCTVVACARNVENFPVQSEKLFLWKCDVSRKEEVDAFFDFAVEKLNRIDLFFANAGYAYYEKLGEPDWEHIERIFATDFESVVYQAQKMKAHRGAEPYNFLVTASAMGLLSLPGYALYSGAKAALRGFADAYRYELGRGQYFEVLYPIATKTKFFTRAAEGTPVPWPQQTPEAVARKAIRGVKRNRKHIFPSFAFRSMDILNRIFPFIFRIYVADSNKKYQKWLMGTGVSDTLKH